MSNAGLSPILPMILGGPDDGGTAAANAFVANGSPIASAAELTSWCQNVDYVQPGLAHTSDDHAIFHSFPNVTMLTVAHVGNPSAQLPCFNPMRTAFVEHPDAKLDTSCVDTSTFKTFS